MRIEQLMSRPTKTCRPDQALTEAAEMMWENDCGCLVVAAEDAPQRLLGIITDRDICMAMRFKGADPNEVRVGETMASEVYSCNPEDPVAEAMSIMREVRVRRLPVVDDSERVIGLISLAGLAREAMRQARFGNPEVTQAEIGSLLAAICEPNEFVWGSSPS